MHLRTEGAGGARTAYVYTGGKAFDRSLPCVVFVHGALHDHSVWTLLARWFAHHGRGVLAVDLPGHGRSEGAPLADVESTADWLISLLDAAGVDTAALVGHSMGSLLALEAAARAPARVRRLVMIGTAYPMRVTAELLELSTTDPGAAIDRVNAFSHAGTAAKPSYPGPGHWLQGGNRALMKRVQARQAHCNLFRHDFGVCDAYAGGLTAAARVRCPVDFVLGAADRMTAPARAAELATSLRASVHTLAAGHALMTESPEALLACLRECV